MQRQPSGIVTTALEFALSLVVVFALAFAIAFVVHRMGWSHYLTDWLFE